jgi:hypothetical protein
MLYVYIWNKTPKQMLNFKSAQKNNKLYLILNIFYILLLHT